MQQETLERVMRLLKRNCPIVAAWKTKGQPVRCLFFGIGDNCEACSYAWPELAQEILDEVATETQGIETYRKRARAARAKAKQMDESWGDMLKSMSEQMVVFKMAYRSAGGTKDIENDVHTDGMATQQGHSHIQEGTDGGGELPGTGSKT